MAYSPDVPRLFTAYWAAIRTTIAESIGTSTTHWLDGASFSGSHFTLPRAIGGDSGATRTYAGLGGGVPFGGAQRKRRHLPRRTRSNYGDRRAACARAVFLVDEGHQMLAFGLNGISSQAEPRRVGDHYPLDTPSTAKVESPEAVTLGVDEQPASRLVGDHIIGHPLGVTVMEV